MHVLGALTVRLGSRDVDGLLLANLHVEHGGVKALDHLAGAGHELDGLAAIVAGIELGAVVERAAVVGLDRLTLVGHVHPLSIDGSPALHGRTYTLRDRRRDSQDRSPACCTTIPERAEAYARASSFFSCGSTRFKMMPTSVEVAMPGRV